METEDTVPEGSKIVESDKNNSESTKLGEDSVSSSTVGNNTETPAGSLSEQSSKPAKGPPVLLFGSPESVKNYGKSALFEFGSKTLTNPTSTSDGHGTDILDKEIKKSTDSTTDENTQEVENRTSNICEADTEIRTDSCKMGAEICQSSDENISVNKESSSEDHTMELATEETNIVSSEDGNMHDKNVDCTVNSEDVSSNNDIGDNVPRIISDEIQIDSSEIDKRNHAEVDSVDIPEDMSDKDQVMRMVSIETDTVSSEISNRCDEGISYKSTPEDSSSIRNDDDDQAIRVMTEKTNITSNIENKRDESNVSIGISEVATSNKGCNYDEMVKSASDGTYISLEVINTPNKHTDVKASSEVIISNNTTNTKIENTASQIIKESHGAPIDNEQMTNENHSIETQHDSLDTISELSTGQPETNNSGQDKLVDISDEVQPKGSPPVEAMVVEDITLKSDLHVGQAHKVDDPDLDICFEDVEVSVFGSDSTDEISRDFLKSLRERSKEILGKAAHTSGINSSDNTDNAITDVTMTDSMAEEQPTDSLVDDNKKPQKNYIF